ncbi:AraC family transcriptional regulator [Chelativorans salis]|uniref:Helix-turn-helix domain-containing protein n=1 Tax=Chelativorans salis TaxID=2978478 RepID=A0ABT2LN02_9HYPH|nr:helix-turn-helix domain-containing protein [Chelativorans sp. EGI FJ00035]MCT7374554.1 helix-turn-helix domain-containing protein [Chelativorans sp. EGI FJ00035]
MTRIYGSAEMQRAEKLFDIEERAADSPFVDKIWRARSVPSPAFISVAASHWEIVIWRQAGNTHVTMRGPETRATEMPIPADAEFFGVQFKLAAFMPGLLVSRLVDRDLTLPSSAGDTFRLGGLAWEIPGYENVEIFLGRLAREGLLAFDPIVEEIVEDRATDLSQRSKERRVRRATGLTLGTIRQIDRAYKATALLDAGVAISDVVIEAGYADQAHLTRSLKRFMGQMPGRIWRSAP